MRRHKGKAKEGVNMTWGLVLIGLVVMFIGNYLMDYEDGLGNIGTGLLVLGFVLMFGGMMNIPPL